jgi:hypothetical protein
VDAVLIEEPPLDGDIMLLTDIIFKSTGLINLTDVLLSAA